MFPWILLGGLAVYLIARASASSTSDSSSSSGAAPTAPPPAGTPLVTDESSATAPLPKDKSLSFGESDGGAPSDPWTSLLNSYDAYYGAGNGFGVPISGMSDILGGGTRQATTGEVQTPRSLPAGAQIIRSGAAEAPLESGTRVTFIVRGDGVVYGTLEGSYAGPPDPGAGSSYVYVDRIAVRPSEEAAILPFGRYTVPASAKSGFSDSLDRVAWTAVEPSSVGLTGFSSPPSLATGDKVPLVVRDVYGNIVIAVTTLRSVKDGIMTVVLDHPWKQQAYKDEGFGSPVFPRGLSQATIEAPESMVLDMSKM